MKKSKIKVIRFGKADVIATSGGFNGFHLVGLGDGNTSNNYLYKVNNGVEDSTNLGDTYLTNDYSFAHYDGKTATNVTGSSFSYSFGDSMYGYMNGYYTLDEQSKKFTYCVSQ